MKTIEQLRAEFAVEWSAARELYPFLPSTAVVTDAEPPAGFDGYYDGTFAGVAYFRLSKNYEPPLGLTHRHRYLHEIGHAVDDLLRTFGMTKAYIRQRHYAWRFKGSASVPDSWLRADAENTSGWAGQTNEMFAESFVVAVMGYVERERTMNWGVPFPADARAFFTGMMREVVPPSYPSIPGWTRLAKADDDALFFYHRTIDNMILAFDRGFTLLGSVRKWWV